MPARSEATTCWSAADARETAAAGRALPSTLPRRSATAALARKRGVHQLLVDLLLRHPTAPRALPHVPQPSPRPPEAQDRGVDERVVEDHVRLEDRVARGGRQQPGVPGARTGQRDAA